MTNYLRYVPAQFHMSDEERRSAADWLNAHDLPRCQPLAFEFRFFNNSGIGTNVIVRCMNCGNDHDATDYGSW